MENDRTRKSRSRQRELFAAVSLSCSKAIRSVDETPVVSRALIFRRYFARIQARSSK